MQLQRRGFTSTAFRIQFAILILSCLAISQISEANSSRKGVPRSSQSQNRKNSAMRRATPTFIEPLRSYCPEPHISRTSEFAADSTSLAASVSTDQILAGHMLRRMGFGPTKKEVKEILNNGRTAFIDKQLNPNSITEAKIAYPPAPSDIYDDYGWRRRWYTRMTHSRKQLLEKMTLIWHEHFATSNEKVGNGKLMHDQEELLRRHALGNFRDFLIAITKDQAMLYWLDNDYNNGQAYDDEGNPVAPNENYARELLQLFTTGTDWLNMDGTPVLDENGVPYPAYTESDVREVARALTGWHLDYENESYSQSIFESWLHDEGQKTILGTTIAGRTGSDGANEVRDVIDIIMRHPSVAPFISKMLIQKLATENPNPDYVFRVATVFAGSGGNLKQTVRAILTDPEFTSAPVVLTQHKEPLEILIGAIRGMGAKTKGGDVLDWSYLTGQMLYYPPSVFSFYPPGQKATLLNTAMVTFRDRVLDEYVSWSWDTTIRAERIITGKKLTTPDKALNYFEKEVLAGNLSPDVRAEIVRYMNGSVSETKFRGALWLVLTSPDYQRN